MTDGPVHYVFDVVPVPRTPLSGKGFAWVWAVFLRNEVFGLAPEAWGWAYASYEEAVTAAAYWVTSLRWATRLDRANGIAVQFWKRLGIPWAPEPPTAPRAEEPKPKRPRSKPRTKPTAPPPSWGPSPSWYETLGIDASASAAEIKAAWRSKARTAHPDGGGSSAAFVALRSAYEAAMKARGATP